MDLADSLGNTKLSIYVLNVVHPLIPDEIISYAKKFKT
jgi:hypothetical protein